MASTSDNQEVLSGWALAAACAAMPSEPGPAHVLVVHDHALLTRGLQVALSRRGWRVSMAGTRTDGDVVAVADRLRPDWVLLDLDHGDRLGDGIELIEPLVALGVRVVMLAEEARRLSLAECLAAGAVGWINTTLGRSEVDAAFDTVEAGRPLVRRSERSELLDWLVVERSNQRPMTDRFGELTPSESGVLAALVDGRACEDIAHQRVEAVTTVRTEIRAVLHKLGARSQSAAVALATEHHTLLPLAAGSTPPQRRSGAAMPPPVLPSRPFAQSA